MSPPVPHYESESERLALIRNHVETAHREIQRAQKLAYQSDRGSGPLAPLRVRLALNKTQNILVKLLVHRLSAPVHREEECVCVLHDGICEVHETITRDVLERIEHAKQVRREHGGRPGYEGFPDVRGERDRYRRALIDIAGYEAWQGDPKPAVIAARALEGKG